MGETDPALSTDGCSRALAGLGQVAGSAGTSSEPPEPEAGRPSHSRITFPFSAIPQTPTAHIHGHRGVPHNPIISKEGKKQSFDPQGKRRGLLGSLAQLGQAPAIHSAAPEEGTQEA